MYITSILKRQFLANNVKKGGRKSLNKTKPDGRASIVKMGNKLFVTFQGIEERSRSKQ